MTPWKNNKCQNQSLSVKNYQTAREATPSILMFPRNFSFTNLMLTSAWRCANAHVILPDYFSNPHISYNFQQSRDSLLKNSQI